MKKIIPFLIIVAVGGILYAQSTAPVNPDTVLSSFSPSVILDHIHSHLSGIINWEGFEGWKLLYFLCGVTATAILAKLLRWFVESFIVQKLASKTKSNFDDIVCNAVGKPLSLLVLTGGVFISSLPLLLSLPSNLYLIAQKIFMAFAAAAVAWGIYRIIDVIDHLLVKVAQKTNTNIDDMIVSVIRKSLKTAVLALSVLFIGQNILGLNITTLLAGAGVVGLAVAFAAQDTIANFFGSMMLVIDQPFTVGDRVVIDKYDGNIESIGFRSTRLRTLDGHLISIPNKNTANTSIENISKRPYLKRSFDIGLVYSTSPEQMEKALSVLKGILKEHEGFNSEKPPLVFFDEFKDSALNIKVVVWYHPADYNKFMDWLSLTNLRILKEFNNAGLEFAYPTNTTFLASDPSRKLELELRQKS